MAFIDKNENESVFINVTQRVGATGRADDLLAFQALLDIVYTSHYQLRKSKPTKGPVSVTAKPARDTVILIKHFQQTIMMRPKPQGYINRSSGKNTNYSTIYTLSTLAELVSIQAGFTSLFHCLRVMHPLLLNILKPNG